MNTKDDLSPNETVSTISESVDSVSAFKPLGKERRNTRGGRPKKSEIEKRIRRDPSKGRGRPPGEAQKIKELMARMLLTNGDAVLKKTIDIALNDDHQHQMAAIKLLMDRALPVSYFESKEGSTSGGQGIVINISGLGTQIQSSQDAEDNVIDVGVSGDN